MAVLLKTDDNLRPFKENNIHEKEFTKGKIADDVHAARKLVLNAASFEAVWKTCQLSNVPLLTPAKCLYYAAVFHSSAILA